MSSALQGAPALRAVKHILEGLTIAGSGPYWTAPVTAFGDIGIGRRYAADNRLVASVLLQTVDTREPTQGQYQWDFTVVVEMFYRVGQDVETAELMLADAYPAAAKAFYENRRLIDPESGLPTVESSRVTGPASNPWYEPLAKQEYRMQVLFLNCKIRDTFDPNQPTP